MFDIEKKLKNRKVLLDNFLYQFYLHPTIRAWVVKIRFHVLKKIYGIKVFNADNERNLKPKLISHNLTALENISGDTSMRRMNMLIGAITAIEKIGQNSKILVIGPRTENDLLILKGLGFKNVVGLDLISYSPLITLGDMHQTTFHDNTFDAIICGWTLSYSANPKIAAQEMARILKSGGLIGIGIEHVNYLNHNRTIVDSRLVELDPEGIRINSSEAILNLFNEKKTIFFNHDAPLKFDDPKKIQALSGMGGSIVMVVFELIK